MNGWASADVTQPKSPPQVITGVVTNQPVSSVYRVTGGGAQFHVVKITASAVTVVGSITAKLQTSIGGSSWVDAKTTAITTNGDVYIKINNEAAGDQTYCPLLNLARVVITTTNAGDTATITEVDELQER